MKSMISFPALALFAASALAGCSRNLPRDSAYTQTTNPSPPNAGGPGGMTTNLPATNNRPNVSTNPPTGANQ